MQKAEMSRGRVQWHTALVLSAVKFDNLDRRFAPDAQRLPVRSKFKTFFAKPRVILQATSKCYSTALTPRAFRSRCRWGFSTEGVAVAEPCVLLPGAGQSGPMAVRAWRVICKNFDFQWSSSRTRFTRLVSSTSINLQGGQDILSIQGDTWSIGVTPVLQPAYRSAHLLGGNAAFVSKRLV